MPMKGNGSLEDWAEAYISWCYRDSGLKVENVGKCTAPYHNGLYKTCGDSLRPVLKIIVELESILHHIELAYIAHNLAASKKGDASRVSHFGALARSLFSISRTNKGVMTLLVNGFDSVARQNLRTMHEIGLSICRMSFDLEYAKSYATVLSADEANRFWHNSFSKGKTENILKTYCAENLFYCGIVPPGLIGDTTKVLGVSAHASGLSFLFPFMDGVFKNEFVEEPTPFSLFSSAFILSCTLSFNLKVMAPRMHTLAPGQTRSFELDPFFLDQEQTDRLQRVTDGFTLFLAGMTNRQET